jgi:hypothetical protein
MNQCFCEYVSVTVRILLTFQTQNQLCTQEVICFFSLPSSYSSSSPSPASSFSFSFSTHHHQRILHFMVIQAMLFVPTSHIEPTFLQGLHALWFILQNLFRFNCMLLIQMVYTILYWRYFQFLRNMFTLNTECSTKNLGGYKHLFTAFT